MSNTKVTSKEFQAIKRRFKDKATAKEVQAEFKRGETVIRRIRKARSWPAYQAENKARTERREALIALEKQTQSFQSMPIINIQASAEDPDKERADRLQRELEGYHKRDARELAKKARQERSLIGRILARFRRTA